MKKICHFLMPHISFSSLFDCFNGCLHRERKVNLPLLGILPHIGASIYGNIGMVSRDVFLRRLSVAWRFFSTPFGIFVNILIDKNTTWTDNCLRNRSICTSWQHSCGHSSSRTIQGTEQTFLPPRLVNNAM